MIKFMVLMLLSFNAFAVQYQITPPIQDVFGNSISNSEIGAYYVLCGSSTADYADYYQLEPDSAGVMPTTFSETPDKVGERHCVITAVRRSTSSSGKVTYGGLGPISAEVVTGAPPSGNTYLNKPGLCAP